MDDAIETLQTCLRLLDLVHRVGEMIREGKYWGALRVSPPFVQLLTPVTGGSAPSSTACHIRYTILRAYPLFVTVTEIVDQGRRHGIDQVVAV
jgi:hypothetical protein